jgi:hypothetical protein
MLMMIMGGIRAACKQVPRIAVLQTNRGLGKAARLIDVGKSAGPKPFTVSGKRVSEYGLQTKPKRPGRMASRDPRRPLGGAAQFWQSTIHANSKLSTAYCKRRWGTGSAGDDGGQFADRNCMPRT